MQRTLLSAVVVLGLLCSTVQAEVPQIINYQGRVVVGTTNFNGTGQFKFALVNANGTTTYWSHDGTSVAGSEPNFAAISLNVVRGLYSVLLGDTSIPNMTSYITPAVFTAPDVRLRVWFNDGTNGWQRLNPDQRIGAVGYAMQAGVAGPWSLNGTTVSYNDGRVGIGTTTPASLLELFNINGSVPLLKLNSTNGNTLFEARAAVPTITFRDTITSNSDPAYGIVGAANRGLRFYSDKFWRGQSTTAFMAMNENGFLGIGTTSPQSGLHISGVADAVRLTGAKPFISLEDTAVGAYSRIQSNGFGMDLKTYGAALNNHPGIIHLNGFGTVGLGTTAPKHHLSIRSFAGGPTWTTNGWLGAIDLDNGSAIAWGANTAGQRFGMGHTNGSFVMFRTAADPGTTNSGSFYDFAITDAGDVGIGTVGPAARLQVFSGGNINTPQAMVTQSTSGDFARLRLTATGSPTAWDIAAGTASGVMNFYASSTGRNVVSLNPNGTVSVAVLNITGGADLAEPFKMKEEELEKGSVVVIDEEHPGRLKRSSKAYDKRVAGIVSGANGVNPGIALQQEGVIEGGQNVSLSGRVYVRADTSGGAIRPGDLLTTSSQPGRAMRVRDHTRAQGAIVGKAMTPLQEGKGEVLVLVTLQ